MKTEKEQRDYLKGYKKGFDSALLYVWALAEELLIQVNNNEKEKVEEFIEKIKK